MAIRALIYVPLHEELQQIQKLFPLVDDLTEKFGFLAYKSKIDDYEIIVTSQNEMGVSTANATAAAVYEYFSPAVIFCVGIAGNLSDDLRIGDVCFSQEIIDINENQKVEKGATKFQPKTYNSNNSLDKKIGLSIVHPQIAPHFEAWQQSCFNNADIEGREHSVSVSDVIRSRTIALRGPIVCGPVVADPDFKKVLKGINRKSLAIETETSGIYQAFSLGKKIEVIAIRGISDSADDQKKTIEVSGKDVYRKIAAFNAATFLLFQFKYNPYLAKSLSESEQPTLRGLEPAEDPIAEILASQGREIEQALNELSPEYRAGEKGYMLPVPRVRSLSETSRPTHLEPLELISKAEYVALDVPTSYPDRGLPWLYARYLLGATHANKIIVPIVINEATLRPPLHNVSHEIEKRIPGITSNSALLPVVILTGVSASNERRTNFILENIKSNSIISIIVGSKTIQSFISQNSLHGSWSNYCLCDVSFRSIVNFLAANFSINPTEAEAIAMRLSDTFRSFNLSVHPTYFAGIPKEMLARLSDANHRAELIDLAVTGFLSFIGAGDTKDVNLKQRTRRLFLQELAYQIVIEKASFSISSLIDYVKTYSEKHDFGLDSNEFVQSFINYGIIHESSNAIDFSISFIRNYLLAERLKDKPDVARKYFNPLVEDIDFATFEIYAEIGLSNDVLVDVSDRLKRTVDDFSKMIGPSPYLHYIAKGDGSYKSSGHPLVDGSIKPKMISNMSRMRNYEAQVEKAAQDLLNDGPDTDTKQKILDLSQEAMHEAHAKKSETEAGERRVSNRHRIYQDWMMSIVLLGSAAEELDANVKRDFIKRIVQVAAYISDDWIRQNKEIDADAIKQKLIESIESGKFGAIEKENRHKEEKLVDLIVDIFEFGHLGTPFLHLASTLGDYARNRVLYESMRHVSADDVVQELFLSLWKLELKENLGIEAFKDVIAKLPKDKFLRIIIAEYLIHKAYWYRGSSSVRAVYASAVEMSLKPINISLPMPEKIDESI